MLLAAENFFLGFISLHKQHIDTRFYSVRSSMLLVPLYSLHGCCSIHHQAAACMAGFTDSNAYLRELTLKSMLPLAPLLRQRTISQVLLKHLAKLQVCVAVCTSAAATWMYGGRNTNVLQHLTTSIPWLPRNTSCKHLASLLRSWQQQHCQQQRRQHFPLQLSISRLKTSSSCRVPATAALTNSCCQTGGRGAADPGEHDHTAGQPGGAPGRGDAEARAAQRLHTRAQGRLRPRPRRRPQGA